MIRVFLIPSAVLALFATGADAADYDVGPIHIVQPWTSATPKGTTVGAGYMKVTNKGTMLDRLTCVAASFAAECQIHTMTMEGGVMQMRPLPNGIEIKQGETIELKPGSAHLMFMGLKQPLEKGKSVKATLQLEKAGTVDVEYMVEAMGAKSAAPTHPMSGMQMH